MTGHWTDRLSEYVDGDLAPEQHLAAEAHLAVCAECAALARELRAVAAHARALSAPAPEADLWRGIEARIGAGASAPVDLATHREARARRRWSFSLPQLAAAAAVLMAVGGALTWYLVTRPVAPAVRRGASPVPGAERGPVATLPAPSARALPRGVAPEATERPATVADFGIQQYDATVAELEDALRANRGRLEPQTVKIVRDNLALIDQAIAQARAALAADPASNYLNAHLANTMRRKVDLLRRVTAIAGQRT